MTAEFESAGELTLDEIASAGRTALYRLYTAEHELLYIGISDNPLVRMEQHAGEKDWWPEVAHRTVVWYQTRAAAEVAETIAIGLEQPKHNKAKRYVRLPEQPLEATPKPRRRRAAPAPVPSAAPSAAPEPDRPAATVGDTWIPYGRFHPHIIESLDAGLPTEWPASLWCVDFYYGDERNRGQGFGYENWLRVRHGGCWDINNDGHRIPEPLDYLRTRAVQRKGGVDAPGGTHDELYVQPDRHGRWIAKSDSPFFDYQLDPLDSETSEQQRRFLFALKRAGRCTSFQLGSRAWADGIEYAEEARVVASIMLLGPTCIDYLERATSCLEARYRAPTLRRSGWAWPCDLHDIRHPRRNGTLVQPTVQRCSCWSDCTQHPECLEENSHNGG